MAVAPKPKPGCTSDVPEVSPSKCLTRVSSWLGHFTWMPSDEPAPGSLTLGRRSRSALPTVLIASITTREEPVAEGRLCAKRSRDALLPAVTVKGWTAGGG